MFCVQSLKKIKKANSKGIYSFKRNNIYTIQYRNNLKKDKYYLVLFHIQQVSAHSMMAWLKTWSLTSN